MKTIIRIIILSSILLLSSSCTKPEVEPVLTPAEHMTIELKQFISDNFITRVWPEKTWNGTLTTRGSDYSFTGQFIRIEESYYNLNELIKFEKRESNDRNWLLLYFN